MEVYKGRWYLKVNNKLICENLDGLIWLRIVTSCCKGGNGSSASKKCENFLSTRQLLASQEQLFATELIYMATK
jgi:hypothetical protein